MELFREPIDFKAIATETGVRKGRIVDSANFGWVVIGHPDIDMICINPPLKKGDIINGKNIKNVKIVNNHWVYES